MLRIIRTIQETVAEYQNCMMILTGLYENNTESLINLFACFYDLREIEETNQSCSTF